MKLATYQNQKAEFEKAGFILPQYAREQVIQETKENPEWLHFGAGNIFRAFTAHLQQKLLNEGLEKTGIIVAEGFDEEIVEKAYRPYNNIRRMGPLITRSLPALRSLSTQIPLARIGSVWRPFSAIRP